MTEVKLPQTEAELRKLLEGAIEYGRQEGPRETGAAPNEQPQAIPPRVSNELLQGQYERRKAELLADPRRSHAKLRALQNEFIEAGLAWEDVDISNHGNVRDERDNDMSGPMAFRRRRR